MCVMALYLSVPQVIEKFVSGEMSGNPGGLIRWPVWLALPLGFTLLLLQGWSELIKCIAFLRGSGPDPTEKRPEKTDEEQLVEALRQRNADSGSGAGAPAQAH
jgi:TRAP-type mannitol/chloroaromatic compound transport system permease small subunit